VLRALVALALAALVVIATASVCIRLVPDEPIQAGTRPTGLAWAERVFTSKRDFASFLSSRGASYEVWAARHPGGAPWEWSVEPAASNGGTRVAGADAPPPARAPHAASASGSNKLSRALNATVILICISAASLVMLRRFRPRPAAVPAFAWGPALPAWPLQAPRREEAAAASAVSRLLDPAASAGLAIRAFARRHHLNGLDVTTYSLAVVVGSAIGLLIVYLTTP
jgi:hypothetical protein